jgi:1,4-dihydroxy-2-naphthoate octaprenyltransferase
MNIYRNWFLASRPWSFSMTAISVSVGSSLAAIDGSFSWELYFLTLLGVIFMHTATNLINDYYDVKNGVDTREVSTAQYRPHPLLEGKLEPPRVLQATWLFYGATAVIGIFLAATRGLPILWIGLIGAFASLTYTAPPLKYKCSALGEISVFLMWGPSIVLGSYFVQRQAFSTNAFWISLPLGILVALVLLANNIRDVGHDRSKGILTLPMVIGRHNGLRLYFALVVLAYLGIIVMALLGPLHPGSLLVLLSLPLAWRLLRRIMHEVPIDADAQTAKLDTAFGVLLLVSLLLEGIR